jgi:allantoicase
LNKKLFVDSWINKLQAAGIKKFPAHFIDPDQLKTITIPIKTLVIGQEFFGSYEIITTDGEPVYQAANYDEAKFFVYGARQRNGKTFVLGCYFKSD